MQIEEPGFSPIEGLRVIRLDVHSDNRGWFKENWQRTKMVAAGLPDFGPVQQNVSFNAERGVTRGLHAEPWDKLVSVAAGKVYGAWCDLREGSATYGETFGIEIDPSVAVFVPRGVANGFQALTDATCYTYLVNDHWSADSEYAAVNLNMIDWPLEPTEISEKDAAHPRLDIGGAGSAVAGAGSAGDGAGSARPAMSPRKILVTGANGQLGRALRKAYGAATHVEFCGREEFDIAMDEGELFAARPWRQYSTIINCAAYNDVNGAETDRANAWAVNAAAPARLAAVASEFNLTLVHVSSDYIFDGLSGTGEVVAGGTATAGAEARTGAEAGTGTEAEAKTSAEAGANKVRAHTEDELPSPLSLYGASKAAGDTAAQATRKHFVIRTAWVFGDGNNFMSTMRDLAKRGVKPAVVHDQRGRPTFAEDLAGAIKHLLESDREVAPYGVYNVTSEGDAVGRDEIAMAVFVGVGMDPSDVTPVSTQQYAEINGGDAARRPAESTLDLAKIKATGFTPRNWRAALALYLALY